MIDSTLPLPGRSPVSRARLENMASRADLYRMGAAVDEGPLTWINNAERVTALARRLTDRG